MRNSVSFWIPFGLFILLAFGFFIFTGNSIYGWCILLIFYLFIFLLRDRIFEEKFIKNIPTWLFIFLMTFFLYAFTI